MIFNVYCDESCHLEHDEANVMTLGAVWCPKEKARAINKRIIDIKAKYNVGPNAEVKWVKVSPFKEQLYLELIDYFFDDDNLHFRGLLVPDKSILNHSEFEQTHDDWYHKMYFDLLKVIFNPEDSYDIYIDIKDTHSSVRLKKLHEVLSNDKYDFSSRIIKNIQPMRSHEVQLMQMVDVFTGALAYRNRIFPENHIRSQAKINLVKKIMRRSGYALNKTTLYQESKFNMLAWEPYCR